MRFLASLPTFGGDLAANAVWSKFSEFLGNTDGICYYRHPLIPWAQTAPDLALLARDYQPLAIRCISASLDDIDVVSDTIWRIAGRDVASPALDLDDFVTGLLQRFDRERLLRRRFDAASAVALPLVSRHEFLRKFGTRSLPNVSVLWGDLDVASLLRPLDRGLSDREWQLAKSVFQGVSPLNKNIESAPETARTVGDAIKILEKDIALLDEEQHKVAIQIAPGPQRRRSAG